MCKENLKVLQTELYFHARDKNNNNNNVNSSHNNIPDALRKLRVCMCIVCVTIMKTASPVRSGTVPSTIQLVVPITAAINI